MNKLFQITSAEPGKQCDFYPYGSLHLDKDKIHYFCEVKEVEMQDMKRCIDCNVWYPAKWPFFKDACCVRCAGKRGINFENKDAYYSAVRAEILIELKDKLK